MKLGHLILRKIIKFVATRCQISRLKCNKIDFRWDSTPDPAGGAYSALLDPLAGFKGAYVYEEEGQERKGKGSGRRRGERETPVPDWESKKVATLVSVSMSHTCTAAVQFTLVSAPQTAINCTRW